MTTTSEIPLISSPQTLGISLLGVVYNLQLVWNVISQAWIIDIADTNNTPILQGVPLVTGVNLLEQYSYLGIGGALYVQSDGVSTDQPTVTNLGTQSHLLFVTP